MTSHRSVCLVSLAGDSLLQTLSKYTCYSFPTRQRRLARPDKAIYPPPAPACADAIANVFPSAGDQYVWKQTNNPALPGRLFPFSGPPLGALTADVHNRINKQRFSRVNTGHNQQRGIYGAKNEHRGPYVPYQGSTLVLALVPSYVCLQKTSHRRNIDLGTSRRISAEI